MEEYFNNQAEIETTMAFRHPWVPLFYNWVIAAIVVVLFGGFVWWGLQIKTQSMADKMLATTLAEMDAEKRAEACGSGSETGRASGVTREHSEAMVQCGRESTVSA